MRTHEKNPEIAMPECLSQLRALQHIGQLTLTDEFRTYSGVIFESEKLLEIAKRFTYEAMGYDLLVEGCGMRKRAAIAEYVDGAVQAIHQANFYPDRDFDLTELDQDLVGFEPTWRAQFEDYSYEVASFLGPRFELRLLPLAYNKMKFHFDPKFIIALQPMFVEGKEIESTTCKDVNGGNIRLFGKMVGTTPQLEHSWPATEDPRLVLAATLYERHFIP